MSLQGPNMDEFLKGRSGRQAGKRLQEEQVRIATRQQVCSMMESGDWSEAESKHLIGLFIVLFERVYGVPCSELSGPSRFYAAKQAGELLEERFDGDAGAMVHYMRWAWEREAEREQWRRQNRRDGATMNWRWMFAPGKTLDEYTLAQARRRP